MGRKRGGGGGASRSSFDSILRDRIESASKSYATVEQMVEHLRSRYVDYVRQKRQPFIRRVESIFQSISRRNDAVHESNDDGDTPITKKRRTTDEKEENLRQIEPQHSRKRSRSGDVSNNSSGGSSSSVVASPSSLEEEDEEVSTSSAELDLMKSENLSRKAKKSSKGKEVKEDMEMEIVNNKGVKNVNMLNEVEGKLRDLRSKINKNDNNAVKGPMFKDLGGISGVIEKFMMRVIVPLHKSQLRPRRELGLKRSMGGILLHGPPGCGKTKLAQAIANEAGLPFYQICATELVSGVSGASEENIRELFSKAYRTAPSIVFIDEIDAIASKRDNMQREMERRIVTQLMTCMSENSGSVIVIGATNRPDAIDGALRRPGRFNREIFSGVPDESARAEILSVLTPDLKVEDDFDVVKIARSTPGFVGADLEDLVDKACVLAMERILHERKAEFSKRNTNRDDSDDWWKKPWTDEEIEKLFVTMNDFEEAGKIVQPSSRREGFSAIPKETWDDVGGLSLLKEEFDLCITGRVQFPELYEGVDLETGFLLYGPPGCGKTLVAKAVAHESGANFIHIKGPEILNKYVGESESEVRKIFGRARTCSPCIIFFDELDALTSKRGTEGGWVVERLVNQLLVELDGAEERRGVYVIGATNRIDVVDPALLRPGRFGKRLYVPLPTLDEREMILKLLTRNKPIDADVDLMALAKDTENFSSADLKRLMREAEKAALKERLELVREKVKQKSPFRISDIHRNIKNKHFKSPRAQVSPSVSPEERQRHNLLSECFGGAPEKS